jgi:MoaA/NifB/PqqE/SkfB family radical SAM enzyme
MTTFDLTNWCNLQCSHCLRINDRSRDMEVEHWKHVLREFVPLGTRYVFAGVPQG